jgi:tripartite-type tricarboxylate transporter receptor subunit TctC
VRAGTPDTVIAKIHADVRAVLRMREIQERFVELGLVPVGNRPEDFTRLIDDETRKWSEIVRKANIKPQS